MINLFNLKNSILAWCAGAIAIMLTIFKIRKGGADAEKQKQLHVTLENVAKASQVQNNVAAMSDAERVRGRKKWTKPR